MNIRWISPLDSAATEIARYSELLMPRLQQMLRVESVEDARGGNDPGWWVPCEESPYRGEAALPVYHIGNNPLHLPIFEQSLREPGMVVLHDLSLLDLARHVSHQWNRPDLWKDQLVHQYGEEVRGLANRSEKSLAAAHELTARFPLFLPFVEQALGVVVHSRYAQQALQSCVPWGAPVRCLNLPGQAPQEYAGATSSPGPLKFVFCGHVGPNRRLLEFFEAWGQLMNPGNITLELFGNIRNRTELKRHATQFGVAEYLDFAGYVDDAALDAGLREADFAINLRWLTMGEASASQLRYWAAGLPTLVTDAGWYGELPEGVVCKISTSNEIGDIVALLEDAQVSPDKYRKLGETGREYLRANHSIAAYVEDLVEFCGELLDRRLGYWVLERELVPTIAHMCGGGASVGLFHAAIEIAVDTFVSRQQEHSGVSK